VPSSKRPWLAPTDDWAQLQFRFAWAEQASYELVRPVVLFGLTPAERAFWRLLYESAARAGEILALNIEDLDLPNKGARVRSKGGATEWVFWQTGAALLLPRLLAGRTAGPVFLAERQPTRAVPSVDRCPVTGRARLSYRRAAELFSEATHGWTLHQLRHSALTHAAEDGTNTPILLARSRHASVRSLERSPARAPGGSLAMSPSTTPPAAVADRVTVSCS